MRSLRIIVVLLALAAAGSIFWLPGEGPEPAPGPGAGIQHADPRAVRRAAEAGPDPAAPAPDTVPAITPGDSGPRAGKPKLARTSIRGRVRDVSGAPLEGIEIVVESRTANGLVLASSTAISDLDGQFSLDGLLADRQYGLLVDPQENFAAYSLDSFIAGKADRLQDIVLQRVELVDIDGMVVDINRAPVANFVFAVRSMAAEFPDRIVSSDSTGYFRIQAFPAGEIRIATNASDYFRIQGLELRPDEYRTLTLVIDRGSYHLGGWVSDENGVPVEEAQVTLKSVFAIGDYHSFSYRSTISDANGAFEFSRLGGERATLSVHANGYRTYIEQHEFASFSDTVNVRLVRQRE